MQTLKKANEAEGVHSAYQIQPAPTRTGACAVVITGHDRTLCTTLRAAEMFTPDHLAKPEIASIVDSAKYFYIEGYFLTHGVESIVQIAKSYSSKGKTVVLNLSAPFIPQFFKVQLEEVLPHVDVLIGNESEAAAYATAAGMGVSSRLYCDRCCNQCEGTKLTCTGRHPRAGRHLARQLCQVEPFATPSRRRYSGCRAHSCRLFVAHHRLYQHPARRG